ncbi:MAG: bifunctional 4-hydroxy-2-oxoglutarate aldolase/2-dehydro-3-deoxy-phosphogluconate aldolase [Acidimicrobiia bacterium]
MLYRWEGASQLARGRVIAIIRTADASAALAAGRTLLAAGMPAVEVSLTVPRALDVIEELTATASETMIGAGTVLDESSGRAALLAGATFLVSPSVAPDVGRTAATYGAPMVMGAGTATEAVAALEAGADLVKLFPAAAIGLETMKALRPALPQVPFVPTGGIGLQDALAWLDAGAVAIGIGGSLTSGATDAIRGAASRLLGELSTHESSL